MAAQSGLPWTVVRSTQFHELAGSVPESLLGADGVHAPQASISTIASAEAVVNLARVATGPALNQIHEVGGPQWMSFADMFRTVLAHQRRDLTVVDDQASTSACRSRR